MREGRHLIISTGILQIGQPVMMVMEYCEHGSLQDYLRERPLLPTMMRDRIALDAAQGLAYLAERGESQCWWVN
jgi:serine/threonine protein kinase